MRYGRRRCAGGREKGVVKRSIMSKIGLYGRGELKEVTKGELWRA